MLPIDAEEEPIRDGRGLAAHSRLRRRLRKQARARSEDDDGKGTTTSTGTSTSTSPGSSSSSSSSTRRRHTWREAEGNLEGAEVGGDEVLKGVGEALLLVQEEVDVLDRQHAQLAHGQRACSTGPLPSRGEPEDGVLPEDRSLARHHQPRRLAAELHPSDPHDVEVGSSFVLLGDGGAGRDEAEAEVVADLLLSILVAHGKQRNRPDHVPGGE
eukprot:763065-Hanusia_phi.AAC.2